MERRTRAWSELLRDSEVPAETVRRTFEETWRIHSEHWRAGRQFTPVMAAERAVEDLGVAVSEQLRDDLVEAFADAARDGRPDRQRRARGHARRAPAPARAHRDHLRRRLHQRRAAARVPRAPSACSPYFDGWAFSDEVGVYKPDPAIFARALHLARRRARRPRAARRRPAPHRRRRRPRDRHDQPSATAARTTTTRTCRRPTT